MTNPSEFLKEAVIEAEKISGDNVIKWKKVRCDADDNHEHLGFASALFSAYVLQFGSCPREIEYKPKHANEPWDVWLIYAWAGAEGEIDGHEGFSADTKEGAMQIAEEVIRDRLDELFSKLNMKSSWFERFLRR